jgi:hypothetical protein
LGTRYRIVFDNAKPESVFVRIIKDGVTVNSWQENRRAIDYGTGSRPSEFVATMLARAKDTARKWVEDDRELARLLTEHGDGVERPPDERS